jgi:TctA family transporter
MEFVDNLAIGFGVALTPANLAFAFLGAMVGTLIGVLPGIGPIATIAMLLPLTFHLEPVSGLIMLAGIFYGAQYGGSTTAILVNLPGETSSVVTCIDGHQMARQGRAGSALAVAALASFFAGCIATGLIAAFAPPLSRIGQSFGAPEYFSLMVLGLVAAVVLAHGSIVKAVAMIVLGLLFGLVGTDGNTGGTRFTFDIRELTDGIDVATLAIGVFGVGEIISNLARPQEQRALIAKKITRLWPTGDDFRHSWRAVLRGTALGSILGLLPGGGATLSSFAAYALEKKSSASIAFGRGGGRRGRTGIRQQCRGADIVYSHAHLGDSGQRGDGADDRRAHHPRHPAGPADHDRTPADVLGHDRQHVDRKPHAGDHQPAADRHVGAAARCRCFLYLAILLFCGIGVYRNNIGGGAVGGVLRRRHYVFMRLNASRC